MKILSVSVENFASYEKLDFEFDGQGLTLIHGATGSGKSTLADIVPWGLFGITAKGGKADEVLSWNGGSTKVNITLEINGKYTEITRTRKPNDLILWIDGGEIGVNEVRGKDLIDTQKLINETLGMDADLYLAGAYYHEFSQTAQFFTTTPKIRRSITEQLVDLSLPIKLQDTIKLQAKDTKQELVDTETNIRLLTYKLNTTQKMITYTEDRSYGWQQATDAKITDVLKKRDNFDAQQHANYTKLETEMGNIGPTKNDSFYYDKILRKRVPDAKACTRCGGVSKEYQEHTNIIHELETARADNLRKCRDKVRIRKAMQDLLDTQNTYEEQLTDLRNQVNPHTASLLKLESDLEQDTVLLTKATEQEVNLRDKSLNLDLLSDAVTTFRSELVKQTIEDLETKTNSLLLTHFEGEIKVGFTMADDKLDVSIQKDTNEASYTQLSKGQRGMLKLCFGIAVMEVITQHHALSFDQVFFDESLDGLDDANKMKAVRMLETLALDRGSIYVVEHSETVKAMIDNKLSIRLVDGKSQIEKK